MWSRSVPVHLFPPRGANTARVRAAGGALLALATLAGLSLIAIALCAPTALASGLPVALLFYPVLWAAAIAAYRSR